MEAFRDVKSTSGWFTESGPEYDVVISSRVRLSRNLSGHRYPGTMDSMEENVVQDKILKAFSSIDMDGAFQTPVLETLSPLERRILMERNIITQEYSLQTRKAVVLHENQLISSLINEIDHLRLSAIHGGLDLRKAFKEVDSLDTKLEDSLEYAASIDWGYLNTEIENIGTGMRASVMLHLPALVSTSIIKKVFKTGVQIGLGIKGFFGDNKHSLGNIYQISNQMTLGYNEAEIINKIESFVLQIVDFERKAREELMEKKKTEMEDMVFRAYGTLKYCKLLASKEAIDLLSAIRMGISFGWIKIPYEAVTALLFLTQKSHIQQIIRSQETGGDSRHIDYTRAKFVRETIEEIEQ